MASDQGHTQEFDLEKTDRLPILTGQFLIPDAAEDSAKAAGARAEELEDVSSEAAVERTMLLEKQAEPALSNPPAVSTTNLSTDLFRNSAIDLPSLAESLRSVEERIVHQQAEYEALSRSFERSRDSEETAKARAGQLEADLAAARTLLQAEQARVRDQEKALAERSAFVESARTRAEEALRESERHQSESRLLKDSLAARDSTISQVLHSLGERDAHLTALQQEHVKAQESLEARGKSHSNLEADLDAAKLSVQELTRQLAAGKESVAAWSVKVQRSDSDFETMRAELGAARAQAASHLELLRTREYRRGFEENLFSEMDAKVGAADAGHNAFKAECDRLRAEAATQNERIVAQESAIEKFQASAAAQTATLAKQAHYLKHTELARAEVDQRLGVAEADLQRFKAELAERETALKTSRSSATDDSKRMSALLASAEQKQQEQAARHAQLQAENDAAVARMQAQHTAAVTELQTRHGKQISDLQSEQMAQVKELQSGYTSSTARAVAEHAAEMDRQKALHASYVDDAESRSAQREQEMSVLMAHLLEARRPIEPIEAEVKRLTDALADKSAAFDELDADARKLRVSLERTRGALEEREFLIRRLERSESNNANVLGRIQTSMERLGSGRISPSPLGNLPECTAELVRIDGGRNITHSLGRRTRIGRGAGCELQVESSSVSRHHALIAVGPRDAIVEDLNSTNGVILNGRKITRAFLTDGDTLIVGEVQFRYVANPGRRGASQPPLESTPVD